MEASRDIIERARRVGRREGGARTLAQSFCLLIGAGLIAGGVLGFVFGGTGFDAGADVQGDDFLIFEVNGWHNVVHIATGAFLVVMSVRAAAAAIGALIFGIVYAAVAAWGLVDGDDVVDLLATDTADNWLHVGLGAAGVLVGLVAGALGLSARREHRRLERAVTEAGAAAATAEARGGGASRGAGPRTEWQSVSRPGPPRPAVGSSGRPSRGSRAWIAGAAAEAPR